MAVCSNCDQSFQTQSNLNRHSLTVHGINLAKNAQFNIFCQICKKGFCSNSARNRHMKNVHSDVPSGIPSAHPIDTEDRIKKRKLQCSQCDDSFCDKSTLNRHLQRKHQVLSEASNGKLECPICPSMFPLYKEVDEHCTQLHNTAMERVHLTFQSFEELELWKTNEEIESRSSFIRRTSKENTIYFNCHRSGETRSNPDAERMCWKPTAKLGKCCPARMRVRLLETGVDLEYQKTHVGHTPSVMHLKLSKEEEVELAGKIQSGVTFDRILDDIKKTVTNLHVSTVQRIHIVEKQDLRNIIREFDLDMDKAHPDDSWSLHFWVQEQMALGDDSPVIYYKPQGVEDPSLKKDDFMLVIMMKYQKEEIAKFTSDKILIDSTHGTTGHDFHMTSLVTIDEFAAGFPVAYCISTRLDTPSLTAFFNAVKEKIGDIKANVFMSDDYPAFINAWNSVMSVKPKHQLLCTWHIDHNWRQNLPKIKDQIKQSEAYKYCRTLLETMQKDVFMEGLTNFKHLCASDAETQAFGQYFEKFYASRFEQWAFCFRRGLGLNTNMYLESIHKILKHFYLNGKKNKRIDKLITALLTYTRNLMYARLIRYMKNKPTHRMKQIGKSHRLSKEVTDDLITSIKPGEWNVKSKSEPGKEPYKVTLNRCSTCPGCPLTCPKCKVCIHKMECSCPNYLIQGNMCKHNHACIRFSHQANIENVFALEDLQPEPAKTIPVSEEAFENIAASVLKCTQSSTSPHVGEAVSTLVKLQSMLSMISGLAASAPDDALVELSEVAEQFLLKTQSICKKKSEVPQLPITPKGPSHANIEPQRMFSIKKKARKVERKFSKPTDEQKKSLLEALKGKTVENIHADFDHQYL